MPNRKKSAKKPGGPYLAAALLCDTTIEDKKDGALSAIRIIDTINVLLAPDAPPDLPSEENRIAVPVTGLLCFKTGGSRKKTYAMRIVMESPSGKRESALVQTIPFTPEAQGGANVRLNIRIDVMKGGLFWLDVFLDDKLFVRMPLMIRVHRQEPPPPAPVDSDGAAQR